MRPDEDIDPPVLRPVDDIPGLFGRPEPIQHFDSNREIRESLCKRPPVLNAENRRQTFYPNKEDSPALPILLVPPKVFPKKGKCYPAF